jgi:hypothetical protein
MMLLVPVAFAGLLDAMTDTERQVLICRQAAAPAEERFDYGAAGGIWDACLTEAKRAGNTDVVSSLEDQVALMKARAKAAPYRTSDVNRYALDVLAVVADQKSATYLGTDVSDIFRAWMATEAGKQRLESVRTVTLVWSEPPADAEQGRRAAEVFRRHVEDLGLKWADAGHPEVDVIVYGALTTRHVDAAAEGPSLPRADAKFEVERVRFKHLDRETDGFRVDATAEDAEAATAEDLALRAACERAAGRLLKQVLQATFR